MMAKVTRKEQFLLDHPRCFACGKPSETWDHLPSQACFDNREYPEEFEFPACDTCNKTTRNDEQAIALMSRTWSDPLKPASPGEISKYMTGVANNHAALFRNMMVDVYERDGEITLVSEGPGVKECFNRVLPKWARAFHYLETREVLPPSQVIYGRRFTVPEAASGKVPELFFNLDERPLKRGGIDFRPQFYYARRLADDFETYTVLFRRAFGASMIIDRKGVFTGPGADSVRLADFIK